MANEAVLVTRTGHPITFTCANATGIEKGAILQLTDPSTVSIANGLAQPAGGIAAAEKIASDGVTQIAVYRNGRFRVYLSGACTVGDAGVTSVSPNYIQSAAALTAGQVSGSRVLGRFLETGTTGEMVLFELGAAAHGFA